MTRSHLIFIVPTLLWACAKTDKFPPTVSNDRPVHTTRVINTDSKKVPVQPPTPQIPAMARKDRGFENCLLAVTSFDAVERQLEMNTEEYSRFDENPFLDADKNPLSTFSVDVDRASYAHVRRYLNSSQRPPKQAVRIEELINYFHYDYPKPGGDDPISITTNLAVCPWEPNHSLLRVGLKARDVDISNMPPNNLVFLIDVSGSMQSEDKLPLLKSALGLLVDQMRPQDRVAIAVYAGAAGLVLPPTSGKDKHEIRAAIDRLEAGGSTAGAAGIRLAYQTAQEHFLKNGNNRVILATDGDFNVGTTSDAELETLIEEKRKTGVFLTVLGFGTGNIKDSKMELLADKGNGNYAYVDSLMEARKVLVKEMGGTLLTVAKDVKLQIEFNPAKVGAYRLIGYENRMLRSEDFNNDAKDAGDMGAGHTVTAFYELVPPGVVVSDVDPLKYQKVEKSPASDSSEWLTVKFRYKLPKKDTSKLLVRTVEGTPELFTDLSHDMRFATAVAGFGMILRNSPHKGTATLSDVQNWARKAKGEDEDGTRAEFIRLVELAENIGTGKD